LVAQKFWLVAVKANFSLLLTEINLLLLINW
jgi:hypothetical protein